jgi:hypothetical protein
VVYYNYFNVERMMMATPEQKPVKIFVNNRAVELSSREATGREIKAAAEVPADFTLYLEHGGNLTEVSNDEVIKLHENERFRAVSGQDVS